MTTLVLAPSLGTSAEACWGPTVEELVGVGDVVTVELPGHGQNRAPSTTDLTIADLASRVLEEAPDSFVFAGDSVGGEIGLQLLLDAPERVDGAVLCCTGARIGTPEYWAERVAQVRQDGTSGLVEATRGRWFGAGFVEREPRRAEALLASLRDTDDDGYVAVCSALAAFDVRDRLGEIAAPVLAIAGAQDPVCPPESLREIADGVQHGELRVLSGVAHQAPAEAPFRVAAAIADLIDRVEEQP